MKEAATIMEYQDPLKIPEVLETIFGYLPLKDLKSSRLVNKHWNVWALSGMKKIPSATVNVCSLEKLSELLTCLKTISGGASNFPCSKFNLRFELIPYIYNKSILNDQSLAEIEVLLSDFLLKISPWVTELKWETCPNKEDDKEIFLTTFPRKVDLPNLKVLKLVRMAHANKPTRKSLRNFNVLVSNILEKASSLKKLSLSGFTGSDDNLIELLVETKISFFTELELIGNIGNSDLETLSKWNRELKLKSVNLVFRSRQTPLDETSLFRFLDTQKGSLEELKLAFHMFLFGIEIGDTTVVTFPEMPNLKTLSIQFPTNLHLSFPEISYTRQFPALKTLHLNYIDDFYSRFRIRRWVDDTDASVFQQLLNPRMGPVDTIQELTFPTCFFSVVTMKSALEAGIFPNVKKLGVVANAEMLRAVINHLPDLEELTLDSRTRTAHYSIDFMLTGFSELEIKTVKERILREGNAFQWNQLELGNINESIAALKKLRVLRFKNYFQLKYLEVSRVSLELILTSMGSLKCVDFGARCYPMETEIDRAWCNKLNKDCILLWSQKEEN